MQVFHFVGAAHGLENIRKRRIKIALISQLNDPFELLSVDLSKPDLRRAFHALKDTLAQNTGLLCFSSKWSNPVLWSHYADRHQGLCLGFDLLDDMAAKVSYKAKRLVAEAEALQSPGVLDEALMRRFLTTKYAHWRYESEVRSFVGIDEKDLETGHYFLPFSSSLKLTHIIVGCRSGVSRGDLSEALGGNGRDVCCFKARMAFRSFKIVRNRKSSFWT